MMSVRHGGRWGSAVSSPLGVFGMSSRSRFFPRLVSTVSTLSLLGVALVVSGSTQAVAASATDPEIVTFAAGTSAAEGDALLAEVGAVQVSSVPQLRMYAVTTDAAGVDALRADARVEHVESDRVRSAEGAPSDPAYADQWALPKIGWDQAYGAV